MKFNFDFFKMICEKIEDKTIGNSENTAYGPFHFNGWDYFVFSHEFQNNTSYSIVRNYNVFTGKYNSCVGMILYIGTRNIHIEAYDNV